MSGSDVFGDLSMCVKKLAVDVTAVGGYIQGSAVPMRHSMPSYRHGVTLGQALWDCHSGTPITIQHELTSERRI